MILRDIGFCTSDNTVEDEHDTFTGALTTDVDVAVVRVPAEPVAASCQFPVEFIEHEIAKERIWEPYDYLITTQAKRNLSSRSGIGGVRSAT